MTRRSRRPRRKKGPGNALALLTLLAVASGALSQVSSSDPTETERIDAVFRSFDNTRSPGCSVAVIRNGLTTLARGYGMADLERSIPLSSDSIFRIASTSKQFTAAAIVLLSQAGKVNLDDDVRLTIPELNEHQPPVSLRQLIHHTSGIRDYLTLMWLAGKRDEDYYDDAEVLAMLRRQSQLNFEPGAEHLYSNSGYWLLSQVVFRVTGASLREYADRAIFQPLAMTDTHFHNDPAEIVAKRALGYAPRKAGGFEISMTQLPMIGDGGVFTSVNDLARWDANFYDPRVGDAAFLDLMHDRAVLRSGKVLPYASGLSHGTYRGLETVGHGGSFVGFRAQMLRFPRQRTTVVCLCNRSDANPTRLAMKVADIVLARDLGPEEAKSDEERENVPEDQKPALSSAQREAIVGDYHCAELAITYHLSSTTDGLELAIGERPPRPVEARSDAVLQFENGDVSLVLERSADGRVAGFLLQAGRVKNLHFRRILD